MPTRGYFGSDNASPCVKDGSNSFVVDGAVHPARKGTKVRNFHEPPNTSANLNDLIEPFADLRKQDV